MDNNSSSRLTNSNISNNISNSDSLIRSSNFN